MKRHYIYEIEGVKVGATVNLEERLLFPDYFGKYTLGDLKILEILNDATDKEVEKIEFYWQDKLGYKRDKNGYAKTRKWIYKRAVNGGIALAAQKGGWSNITPEQQKNAASKGGKACAALHGGWASITQEQRIEYARKGGLIGGKIGGLATKETTDGRKSKGGIAMRAAIYTCSVCGKSGKGQGFLGWHESNCGKNASINQKNAAQFLCTRERICPHCGKVGQGVIMDRWHFDRCSKRL